MGWSESERGLCKKHPEVKQFPGAVCSTCLSEKLSQLYAPPSFSDVKVTADFLGYGFLPIHSRSSSNYTSASISPRASPPVSNPGRRGLHRRNASEVMGRSVSFMFSSNGTKGGEHHGLMKKSRSVAVVTKSGGSHSFGDQGVMKSGKKKRGFWSKLIKGTGRKTKQVLKHSKIALR
ncbi:uncharacterized protein LOC126789256 [Argentina anserina]|uniref:uncharacterized protein LOC126789256 n=1 Tax=Argentina anserina TaxID=57926 RepID=UPI0021764CD0|nr:uncharacterized protein LOC126789256 [Potentilla anserina]